MHSLNSQINELVSKLAAFLQPYEVSGVSLDYIETETRNRRILILERYSAGPRYATITPVKPVRLKAQAMMLDHFNMPADIADQVLDLANELSELNDMGSWPLVDLDDRQPRVVDEVGLLGENLDDLPGFRAEFSMLQDNLREIDLIEFVHSSAKVKAREGRFRDVKRFWIRFVDFNGNEVCTISQGQLNKALTDFYSPENESTRSKAQLRLHRWARQVGVDGWKFTRSARSLLQFEQFLNVTAIDLKGGQ